MIFFLETLRNVTILLSTREQLVTQRRLNNNSRWINRAQHPSKPVKGLFGQSSTRGEGDGWSWMGLLLTKRESSPPFITLPLLHPFCSPKGWMLQCEKPCVCLVSLEYVTRCDKPPPHKPTTLSPNANKLSTHTSASNKFRRQIACSQRHNILFINLLEEEGEDALFPKKKIFCLFGFCIAGNSALINLKWEEEVRCWLWLSLSLLFKLIWDLQLQQLTHRVNGNLKVLTSITSLNKLRRCSNKRRSCCLQIN